MTSALIKWYERHKRDLPWRGTKDPYRIWVAEIILQQTRVQQGLQYYLRFLELFPDVRSLAAAPADQVLKAWQGLGYYSRARNMQATAKEIVTNHNALFPSDYEDIIKLKGIGEYTASAILSFAFGKPYPVMDGNVVRFFSRLFGISEPVRLASTQRLIRGFLEEHIDTNDPATFNQAVMEFGAIQCTPGIPDCQACIFKESCIAFREGKVGKIPVKSARQKVMKISYEYFVPLWKENGEWMTLVKKRSAEGIWSGLYEFPLVEAETPQPTRDLLRKFLSGAVEVQETSPHRHVLSHREINAVFTVILLSTRPGERKMHGLIPVSLTELDRYPVSRLVENFLESDLPGMISNDGR